MAYPKEYLDLQFDFAKRQSGLRGITLPQAILEFTGISRSFNLRHERTGASNEAWSTYEQMLDRSIDPKQTTYDYYVARQKIPFDQETRYEFGCFSHSRPDREGLLHIHFSNHDGAEPGPLSRVRQSERIQELTAMFGHIKHSFSDSETVAGFSWLYNLNAYKRLFPPEFGESGQVKEWFRSLALWGQFLDSSEQLRVATATQFIACITGENNANNLLACFPFKPLETRAPIQSFYKFYKI